MAYSEALAGRVRKQLAGTKRVTEQEMFGGLAFMVAGHMCCVVVGDELMVRVGPDLYHDALTRPHVSETDVRGRAVRGMVYVGREGLADDGELQLWVRLGVAFAGSLPARPPAKKATAKKAVKKAVKKAGKKPVKAKKAAARKR